MLGHLLIKKCVELRGENYGAWMADSLTVCRNELYHFLENKDQYK